MLADERTLVVVTSTPTLTSLAKAGGCAAKYSAARLETLLAGLVPAEVIADIYRHRWTIELFFRFLKHVLGCRRLLSTHPAGIEIQAYCAIIACLLISLFLQFGNQRLYSFHYATFERRFLKK
jgi:IS4 transposase